MMDASTALSVAERYTRLETLGWKVKDATETSLGVEYQKLHADVKFVLNHKADINEKDDASTPILGNRPELGTLWQPNVTELLQVCTPSKFGHGNQTVFDPSVRRSVELVFGPDDELDECLENFANLAATELFVTPVVKANESRDEFIDRYAPKLEYAYSSYRSKHKEPTNASLKRRCQWLEDHGLMEAHHKPKIALEADKLVVYRPGDHFDEHRDTVRAVNHIGTVVITLPNPTFTGGHLEFPTEGLAFNEPNSVVAFYTDVRHRINPVETGVRISITFRVLLTNNNEAKLPPSPRLYDCEDDQRDCESSDGLGCLWNDLGKKRTGLPGTAEIFGEDSIVQCPKFVDGKFVKLLRAQLAAGLGEEEEEEEEEDEEDDEEEGKEKQSRAKKPKCTDDRQPAVVLGCVHMVPAAALQPDCNLAESLRGVDKQVAESLLAIGFKIELVAVRVVTTREVYDGCEPDEFSRQIRVYAKKDLSGAVFVRAGELEAITLEHHNGCDYTGNESAPDVLTYMCAAMAVTL